MMNFNEVRTLFAVGLFKMESTYRATQLTVLALMLLNGRSPIARNSFVFCNIVLLFRAI